MTLQEWLDGTTNNQVRFAALTEDAQKSYYEHFTADDAGLVDMLSECLGGENINIRELGEKVKSAWEEYLNDNLEITNDDLKIPFGEDYDNENEEQEIGGEG